MANFLDKFKIKSAVETTTKLDLSCDHITTANFMQYNVAWSKELVPNEKISVNMETFTRLQPMPVPTFGRARINNRAFFVPFRTVFPGWNDFITDVRHTFENGTADHIQKVPTFSNIDLLNVLLDSDAVPGEQSIETQFCIFEELTGPVSDSDHLYDFVIPVGNVSYGMKLKSQGRWFIKFLNSLGYNIIFSNPSEDEFAVEYSALPLLCALKIFVDWYYPSHWASIPAYTNIEAIFNRDNSSYPVLSWTDIRLIINFIHDVYYDSDYFVSAWQNPMSPNNDTYSSFSMPDFTMSSDNSVNAQIDNSTLDNGTPVLNTYKAASSLGKITQYGLEALRSLTDYMKRHQLVGGRALDRYMARFGITLSPEKLKRSVYIGTTSDDIQFGDVMSTADTESSNLGNYAGKGIGYGKSDFDFETDEYGMMIIISTIQPKAGYFQGNHRHNKHISRLDFWTPEFDNLGTQAISKDELYVPINTVDFGYETTPSEISEQVFGFTPRYAEYKVGRDILSGDFRYNSMNVGQNSWHTMRELNFTASEDIVITPDFVSGSDADQYSRIFYNTDAESADKFNIIYHFNVASYSPMKALYETYDFENKGKDLIMQVNGVKMN